MASTGIKVEENENKIVINNAYDKYQTIKYLLISNMNIIKF